MDKQNIKVLVESYINNKIAELPINFEIGISSREQFELKTVKRLKVAYEMLKGDKCYQNDFLLSLRDYLLVFETDIQLDDTLIPSDNDFTIKKDNQTGRFFCTYQLPEYIDQSFVKQAFLKGVYSSKGKDKVYNLHTDPFIYNVTGFTRFKSIAQKLAVYGALNTPDGYTTLVSLPTGGGKSLITQTMSYQKDGLTVIIVPTVSLAIDQVRVAKRNIKTKAADEEIFSYSSGVDANPILKAIKSKTAKMLFISPESLINNQGFVDVIREANKSRYLRNIIIDEAHIVVDWGASFRVDYQCLESWRSKLMITNPSIRTVLLSATYEQRCIDILKHLFSRDNKWIEIRCDSLRHEPRYMLVNARSYSDKNRKLLEMVKRLPHPMIIYVAKPDDAENIKEELISNGITNVKTFTGLTSSSMRKELIDAWVDDQFEIMVATSAFGVGVDKSDVRTVLHMYIPQNPNAYYQELGRGGRDMLPCLSIMCIHHEDIDIAFQRISKKVMTTEKIIGRWNSMYNSKYSQRLDNLIYMDTSIKPNYNISDDIDDMPASDADMNWNIYVILLLRRYNLIKIHEVLPYTNKYIFVIEIIDDILRNNNEIQFELINKIRSIEWYYFNETFQLMKKAIKESQKRCWSEMFFETYDKVSEYCSGCNAHREANESDFCDYILKVSVKMPVRELDNDQLTIFGEAREAIVITTKDKQIALLNALLGKRLSVLVTSCDTDEIIMQSTHKRSILILNIIDLHELMKKSNFYYVSGIVAVVYEGTTKEIFRELMLISNYLSNRSECRIIHIIPENVYFDFLDKAFSDLVDGLVIPIDTICK